MIEEILVQTDGKFDVLLQRGFLNDIKVRLYVRDKFQNLRKVRFHLFHQLLLCFLMICVEVVQEFRCVDKNVIKFTPSVFYAVNDQIWETSHGALREVLLRRVLGI